MSRECEDKIEVGEFDLEALSLEELMSMMRVLETCQICKDCDGQMALLKREIESRGGRGARVEEDDDDDD